MLTGRRLLLVAALAACLQCSPSAEPPPALGPGESWAEKPSAEWPRAAMVNRIEYLNSVHPVAGCSFLLDMDGTVVAATAKHVLIYFKSEAMDSVSFRGTLKNWSMYPKDAPSSVVIVGELLNEDPDEPIEHIPIESDWLLFAVKEYPPDIQPLRLRDEPLREGESVSILGWRYTEDHQPQIVYEGTVVRVLQGSVEITVPALIDNKVPGLSGAPVIDARGYVIGLMSRGSGKIQRLSSVDYALSVLAEGQNAPDYGAPKN